MKTNKLFSYLLAAVLLIPFVNIFSQNLEEGKKLLWNESYQKAIAVLQSYNNSHPGKADGFYFLGKTYLSEGNIDSAKISFQQGIKANSEYPMNYVGMGGIFLASFDTNSAVSNFNKALDLNSDDASIPVNIADMYLLAKYFPPKRALDYLEQALSLNRKNPFAYLKLGDVYLVLNNGTQSITNYQKAIDYDSARVEGYVGLGNVYTAVRNYSEAEKYYLIAERVNPSYSVTFRYLSDMYSLSRENDKSVDAFKKYIALSENSNTNLKKLATLLYTAKQYKECADVLSEVLKSESDNVAVLHLLAYTYSQVEDTANGIPAFNKYLAKADAKDITVTDYELLSKLYLKSKQDSLAIESLKKAVNLDSTRLDLVNTIEVIYYKDRDWPGVINTLQKKLQAHGSLNAQEYFDLGKAYYFNKDYGLADTAFTKLTELKPDLPIGYRWIAASKANLDPDSEKGLAKADYEKFISLAESDTAKYKTELIEAYSYLGYYYFIKKDMENSKLNWQKVYALDPTNAQAIEAIKKIK